MPGANFNEIILKHYDLKVIDNFNADNPYEAISKLFAQTGLNFNADVIRTNVSGSLFDSGDMNDELSQMMFSSNESTVISLKEIKHIFMLYPINFIVINYNNNDIRVLKKIVSEKYIIIGLKEEGNFYKITPIIKKATALNENLQFIYDKTNTIINTKTLDEKFIDSEILSKNLYEDDSYQNQPKLSNLLDPSDNFQYLPLNNFIVKPGELSAKEKSETLLDKLSESINTTSFDKDLANALKELENSKEMRDFVFESGADWLQIALFDFPYRQFFVEGLLKLGFEFEKPAFLHAYNGNCEKLKDCDINVRDVLGYNTLAYALAAKKKAAIEFITGQNPDFIMDKGNWLGINAVQFALKNRDFESLDLFLTNAKLDLSTDELKVGYCDIINTYNENEKSQLPPILKNLKLSPHFYAFNGDFATLQTFTEGLNSADKRGYLPIHYAIQQGQFEIIDFLIKKFPHQVNVQALDGMTPFIIAVLNATRPGYIKIINYLRLFNPDLKLATEKGITAESLLLTFKVNYRLQALQLDNEFFYSDLISFAGQFGYGLKKTLDDGDCAYGGTLQAIHDYCRTHSFTPNNPTLKYFISLLKLDAEFNPASEWVTFAISRLRSFVYYHIILNREKEYSWVDDQLLNKILKNNEWTEHSEIAVLATILNCNFIIINSSLNQVYPFKQLTPEMTIRLGQTINHYNYITRNENPNPLRNLEDEIKNANPATIQYDFSEHEKIMQAIAEAKKSSQKRIIPQPLMEEPLRYTFGDIIKILSNRSNEINTVESIREAVTNDLMANSEHNNNVEQEMEALYVNNPTLTDLQLKLITSYYKITDEELNSLQIKNQTNSYTKNAGSNSASQWGNNRNAKRRINFNEDGDLKKPDNKIRKLEMQEKNNSQQSTNTDINQNESEIPSPPI